MPLDLLQGVSCNAWDTKQTARCCASRNAPLGQLSKRCHDVGVDSAAGATGEVELGAFLRSVRQARRLTLRAVETATDRTVTNGYLSQIESGAIRQPSPNVLYRLADVYGLEYRDLLRRAGHQVPKVQREPQEEPALNGIPLRSLDLTPTEQAELMKYLTFLRSQQER